MVKRKEPFDNDNEEGEDASVCQEVLRRGGEGPSVSEYGERLDKARGDGETGGRVRTQ